MFLKKGVIKYNMISTQKISKKIQKTNDSYYLLCKFIYKLFVPFPIVEKQLLSPKAFSIFSVPFPPVSHC